MERSEQVRTGRVVVCRQPPPLHLSNADAESSTSTNHAWSESSVSATGFTCDGRLQPGGGPNSKALFCPGRICKWCSLIHPSPGASLVRGGSACLAGHMHVSCCSAGPFCCRLQAGGAQGDEDHRGQSTAPIAKLALPAPDTTSDAAGSGPLR